MRIEIRRTQRFRVPVEQSARGVVGLLKEMNFNVEVFAVALDIIRCIMNGNIRNDPKKNVLKYLKQPLLAPLAKDARCLFVLKQTSTMI